MDENIKYELAEAEKLEVIDNAGEIGRAHV